LSLYGEGVERESLQEYINKNNLKKQHIKRQSRSRNHKKVSRESFRNPSFKSEGWPKAIAEGMFWGCVPLAYRGFLCLC
jgi:hypothetical protein